MAKSLITAVLSGTALAYLGCWHAVVHPLASDDVTSVVLVFRTGPYTFGQTLVKP